MTYIIYKDKKKVIEVLEWIEIKGKMHPKHQRTTYFDPKDRPDFGQKNDCIENIIYNENLRTL